MWSRSIPKAWRLRAAAAAGLLLWSGVMISVGPGRPGEARGVVSRADAGRVAASCDEKQERVLPEVENVTEIVAPIAADAGGAAGGDSARGRETFERLLAENPADALLWLGAMPVEQHAAIAGDIDRWWPWLLQHDERRATEVIAEFPPGEVGTALAGRIAACQAEKDPAMTTRWALTLPYRSAREAALREALMAWARRDRAGMARFLAEEDGAPLIVPGLSRRPESD